MEEPEQLAGGELNAAVTSALVGIHHKYLGRGPKTASTFHYGNVLVAMMHEVLTHAEKSLAQTGQIARSTTSATCSRRPSRPTSVRLSCESRSTWGLRRCQNPRIGPTFLSRSTRSQPPPRSANDPGRGRRCANSILIPEGWRRSRPGRCRANHRAQGAGIHQRQPHRPRHRRRAVHPRRTPAKPDAAT
jgi:Na+-translocating membrane potential-generating system (MpsC)